MARLATLDKEIKHLIKISKQIPIVGIVHLLLIDNSDIEGVVRRITGGNYSGGCYGELEIETLDKEHRVVDYLDIRAALDVTKERRDKYETEGLFHKRIPEISDL
jgi:hypothetical protein